MPTYEYECEECGHRFDYFQKMSDRLLTECPEWGCSQKADRRRIRRHLQGEGLSCHRLPVPGRRYSMREGFPLLR